LASLPPDQLVKSLDPASRICGNLLARVAKTLLLDNSAPPRAGLKKYAAYFLVWTIVGLFYFSQNLARRIYWHDPTPWQKILLSWMLAAYISGVLAPAVPYFGRRWPIERRSWPRRTALHVLFSVCFSLAQLLLETSFYLPLGILSPPLSNSFWSAFSACSCWGSTAAFSPTGRSLAFNPASDITANTGSDSSVFTARFSSISGVLRSCNRPATASLW
jgi:hypothetical protein